MRPHLLLVALVACSSSKDPPPENQPAPPQTPPAPSVAEVWDAWEKAVATGDGEALAALYADDATVIPASSGMTVTGPKSIAEFFSTFGDAFPDMRHYPMLRLIDGRTVASVSRSRGTHTKPMMGMPATNRPMSFLGMSVAEIDNDGKIKKQVLYADNLNFMAQLGMWEGPHRPVDTSDGILRRLATAEGTDTEAANEKVVFAGIEAFNAHDGDALAALYAPDATVSNQAAAGDFTGAEVGAAYEGFFSAFSDAKKSDPVVWSAGDWVVCTYTMTATNDGPVERLGLSEPSGKTVRVEVGEVYRIQNGMIAEHWVFADGLAMAMQLGAMNRD